MRTPGVVARGVALVLWIVAVAGGCRRGGPASGAAEKRPAAQPVAVQPQDIAIAQVGAVATGPIISGTLQPAEQATLRAQVAGTVTGTFADEGQSVDEGALLARISNGATHVDVLSAESAVRSAKVAADNARRDVARYRTLFEAGAVARQQVETAQGTLAAAEAQLANARAALAQARQTAGNTTVQAPIPGKISDRAVSAGDVVQVGTALFTIVNPSTMRLEAQLPSDWIGSVHVGDPVSFEVRGYPGLDFTGRVSRINPVANASTRQVPILVSIPNRTGTLVAGLFAEGKLTAGSRKGIVIPTSALVETGGTPAVVRISNGHAEQVAVQIGVESQISQEVDVLSGLEAGDTVLVGPAAQGITAGTPVRVVASTPVTENPAARQPASQP